MQPAIQLETPIAIFASQPVNICTWSLLTGYLLSLREMGNYFYKACVAPYSHLGPLQGIHQASLAVLADIGQTFLSIVHFLNMLRSSMFYVGVLGIVMLVVALNMKANLVLTLAVEMENFMTIIYYLYAIFFTWAFHKLTRKSEMRLYKKIGASVLYVLLMLGGMLTMPLMLVVLALLLVVEIVLLGADLLKPSGLQRTTRYELV